MKSYEKIKEMLCEELETIAKKGELTAGSLDTVDKLTHAIKSLETIIAMSEYSDTAMSDVIVWADTAVMKQMKKSSIDCMRS